MTSGFNEAGARMPRKSWGSDLLDLDRRTALQ